MDQQPERQTDQWMMWCAIYEWLDNHWLVCIQHHKIMHTRRAPKRSKGLIQSKHLTYKYKTKKFYIPHQGHECYTLAWTHLSGQFQRAAGVCVVTELYEAAVWTALAHKLIEIWQTTLISHQNPTSHQLSPQLRNCNDRFIQTVL